MPSIKAILSASAIAFFSATNAHMKLATPPPYGSPNNSPLDASGSDFPCKATSNSGGTVTNMPIGSKQTLKFIGGAVHGGGSCQVSLTTDNPATKNSKWMVIHSIIGGCPARGAGGNIGDVADAADPNTYDYTIPQGIAPGTYTLAWTWFNKVGNREMYMNCANIKVTGGSSKRDTYLNGTDDYGLPELSERATANFPAMFKANIPTTDCQTADSQDVLFPDPGASVESAGAQPPVAPTGPKCGASGAAAPAATGSSSGSPGSSGSGASGSSGSGASGSSGSGASGSSGSGASGSGASGSSGSGASGSSGSGASGSSGSGASGSSGSGAAPAAGGSGAAGAASPAASPAATGGASAAAAGGSAPAGSAALPDSQTASAAGASPAAAPSSPAAAAAAPSTAPSASGNSAGGSASGSTAPAAGSSTGTCTQAGQSICSPDGRQIGTCTAGNTVTWIPVAAGTKCSGGLMVASKRSAKFAEKYMRRAFADLF